MFAMLFVAVSACAADEPGGWPELFPAVKGFERKILKAFAMKELTKQEAVYTPAGGKGEVSLILMRDFAFRGRFTPEIMNQSKPKPKALEIGKMPAYLTVFQATPGKPETLRNDLVIVLSNEKLVLLSVRGTEADLVEIAKKLDLDAVSKALDSTALPKK